MKEVWNLITSKKLLAVVTIIGLLFTALQYFKNEVPTTLQVIEDSPGGINIGGDNNAPITTNINDPAPITRYKKHNEFIKNGEKYFLYHIEVKARFAIERSRFIFKMNGLCLPPPSYAGSSLRTDDSDGRSHIYFFEGTCSSKVQDDGKLFLAKYIDK